jgi:hypothetical protein
MTDAAATPAPTTNTATAAPEMMSWDSKSRRVVMLYVPLACFVIILLFPFYWMTVTAFKPNAELYDFQTHNPFWITSPTLDHIYHLLFRTDYPRWLWTTMWWRSARPSVAAGQYAGGLCDPAAALPRQPVCRAGDLPRLSRPAIHPVHPAGDDGVSARPVRHALRPHPDLPDTS